MPDVPLWPNCNIGCVFCSNPTEGYRGTEEKYSYEEFLKKWELYKAGEKVFLKFDAVRDYFNFTGGEPTLHPQFLRILGTVRKDFPRRRIKLLSNGRLFRYEDFARRTLAIGRTPFEVAVPMFGYDAKTHEGTARARGSFADTVAGLDNLFKHRRPGQRIECRVILTRPQMRCFGGLIRFLLERFPPFDTLDLLFVELEGFAGKYARQLFMPMRDCAQAVAAEARTLSRFKQWRMLHFALCAVPETLWPHVWNTLDPIKVAWAPGCSRCAVRRDCVGITKGYAETVGTAEFAPLARAPEVPRSGDRYHPFLEAPAAVPAPSPL